MHVQLTPLLHYCQRATMMASNPDMVLWAQTPLWVYIMALGPGHKSRAGALRHRGRKVAPDPMAPPAPNGRELQYIRKYWELPAPLTPPQHLGASGSPAGGLEINLPDSPTRLPLDCQSGRVATRVLTAIKGFGGKLRKIRNISLNSNSARGPGY